MDKAEFYREARGDRTGPIDGVRVVDCTTAWAGPMVGCLLADLGADVVHIDMPGGLGYQLPPILPGTQRSFLQQTVNRNKRSLSLDLRRLEAREVFLALVAQADIVVENFKPGTLAGWGIGYEDCQAVKADVVYVSVSGWGQFGPWSERAGYDPAALAAGGWMSLNGSPDGPPVKAPTFLADDIAGLHGALSALAALHHRDQTGEGQHVDVALLDALLFQCSGHLTLGALDVPLRRWGSQLGVTVPCDVYRCTDGHVYVAIALDTHWRRMVELMGRPELAEDPTLATNNARIEHRDAANQVLIEWCANRSVDDALGPLLAAGLVAARVNSFADAAREPHVLARDMLQPTPLADGSSAPITGPAAKFSRTPTRVRHGAPDPGANTDEILDAIGITPEQKEKLRAAGIV